MLGLARFLLILTRVLMRRGKRDGTWAPSAQKDLRLQKDLPIPTKFFWKSYMNLLKTSATEGFQLLEEEIPSAR